MLAALAAATGYLQAHRYELTRERMDEFNRLSRCVRVQAIEAGIGEAMPDRSALSLSLNFSNIPQPVRFEGVLSLPGDWINGLFYAHPRPDWEDAVAALREQAESLMRGLEDAEELLPEELLPEENETLVLSETDRRIIAKCRRKAFKGQKIATDLGLSYDYIRRRLARLMRSGHLRNTDKGYHVTM
jgi:hypothetical protein